MGDSSLQHTSTYRRLEQEHEIDLTRGKLIGRSGPGGRKHQANGLQFRRLRAAGTED